MADITFREAALLDLDRHDGWRASLEPPAPPIAEEIVIAILRKLLACERFDEVPYTSVTLRGESFPVKRMLVRVGGKTFVTFLAAPRGRACGGWREYVGIEPTERPRASHRF